MKEISNKVGFPKKPFSEGNFSLGIITDKKAAPMHYETNSPYYTNGSRLNTAERKPGAYYVGRSLVKI
jgi:hypothetical protein